MIPDCFKNYPNLKQFLDRFEELPRIAAYMRGSRYMAAPINNKHAQFGAK
jgi:glutathione S-transferase